MTEKWWVWRHTFSSQSLSQDWRLEGSVYDLTHKKFLGHYRPEEKRKDVVMSLAVEDPWGTPLPAQSDAHTYVCAYKSPFWVRRSHVRESVFHRIRLHPTLMEVGQALTAGWSINQVSGRATLGWSQPQNVFPLAEIIAPYWCSKPPLSSALSDSWWVSLEETISVSVWCVCCQKWGQVHGGNPETKCKHFTLHWS